MESLGNVDVVRGCYAGFGDSVIDVDQVAAAFDPDLTWVESCGFPYAGTYRGARAVFEEIGPRLASEWEGWEAMPDYFVAEGDRVVVIGSYTALHRVTGRRFNTRFAHSWRLENGRVVHYEQITDSVPIREACEG